MKRLLLLAALAATIALPGMASAERLVQAGSVRTISSTDNFQAAIAGLSPGDIVTVCTPASVTTTYTPVTSCGVVTTQVATGRTICAQNMQNGGVSADFAGSANCYGETVAQDQTVCDTQNVAVQTPVAASCYQQTLYCGSFGSGGHNVGCGR